MRPVQVTGEVLSTRKVGAYTAMTVTAPGIAENVRPGHFVAFSVGGAVYGARFRYPQRSAEALVHQQFYATDPAWRFHLPSQVNEGEGDFAYAGGLTPRDRFSGLGASAFDDMADLPGLLGLSPGPSSHNATGER